MYFTNPIIKGFHPDPSTCRRGDDYFLVTSSMEYYPGIPVFHSKDLVNWKQIGHVLNTPSALNLDGVKPSGGIMAPTIRYYDGVFYVACMGNGKKGHFVCKTDNPFKGWSEPYHIGGVGIDSSLFFDDDGKAWFQANRPPKEERYLGEREIWLQEFDYHKLELTGEIYSLWSGMGDEY
ncbi:MAG: glycoside hydrolase family 43 protein, partial [Lachnospiraceae bacterium]|nr:glycoside hydrolase family 43 protein [Lachnospiraceae bacterium]